MKFLKITFILLLAVALNPSLFAGQVVQAKASVDDRYQPGILQRIDGVSSPMDFHIQIHYHDGEAIMAVFVTENSHPLGFETGDELISVNGRNIEGSPFLEAGGLVRFRKGEAYTLSVRSLVTGLEKTISVRCKQERIPKLRKTANQSPQTRATSGPF